MCVYIYIYIMSQTHNRLLPKYNVCVYKTGYSQNAIISTVSIDVSIENHSILNYTVNTFCMSNFRLHPKYIYFNPFYSMGAWVKCVCSLPTSIRQFKLQKKLSVCNTFRYLWIYWNNMHNVQDSGMLLQAYSVKRKLEPWLQDLN